MSGNKHDSRKGLRVLLLLLLAPFCVPLPIIAAGVLVQVIFGDGAGWFDGVVGRLMGLVSEFSSGGFVGLIALVIVLSLFNRRTA